MGTKDEEARVVVVERGGSGVLPFIVGAAVGALLGVLFAPRPGEETRRRIRGRLRELRDEAASTVEDALAEARRQIESGLATARRALEEQAEELREVFEAGRAAARETREEIRRRRQRPAEGTAPAGGGEEGRATAP
jgi:gas vesicle protein